MKSSLPVPIADQAPALPSPQEVDPSREGLESSLRFVAYGRKFHDAAELVGMINDRLDQEGITGPDVYYSYDVANIQDAFFGRGRKPRTSEQAALATGTIAIHGRAPQAPAESSEKGDIVRTADTEAAEPEAPAADTLPMGVMIFPEMRMYREDGVGMTVDTPYERIEELCKRYGVPFVHVSVNETPTTLEQRVAALVPAPKELPPAS